MKRTRRSPNMVDYISSISINDKIFKKKKQPQHTSILIVDYARICQHCTTTALQKLKIKNGLDSSCMKLSTIDTMIHSVLLIVMKIEDTSYN